MFGILTSLHTTTRLQVTRTCPSGRWRALICLSCFHILFLKLDRNILKERIRKLQSDRFVFFGGGTLSVYAVLSILRRHALLEREQRQRERKNKSRWEADRSPSTSKSQGECRDLGARAASGCRAWTKTTINATVLKFQASRSADTLEPESPPKKS